MTPSLRTVFPLDPGFDETVARIEKLRLRVWSKIVGDSMARERFGRDSVDCRSIHVLLELNERLIAAARVTLCKEKNDVPDLISFQHCLEEMHFPLAVMSRTVVAEAEQGRGHSTLLTSERMKLAEENKMREIWVESDQRRTSHLCNDLGFRIAAESPDKTVPGKWWLLRKGLLSRKTL